MAKLPSLRVIEAPAWQRERLQLWMEEWALDLSLRKALPTLINETTTANATLAPDLVANRVRPYDQEIQLRQIRLLGPHLIQDADYPIYLAVLSRAPNGLFLSAPFSRFGIPATPGEWLTRRQAKPLRVLSLWNTRMFTTLQLKESWLVGELTESESAIAWEVFESQIAGESLSDSVAVEVGPPIFHPRDPRLQYQAEEVARFDSIGAAPEVRSPVTVTAFVSLPTIFAAVAEQELALAADAADADNRPVARDVLEVPAFSLFVRAYLAPDAKNLIFLVEDAQGQPSDALDGSSIVAKDGRILAPIQKGGAIAPLSGALPDIGLRLASGEQVQWRRSIRT